MKLTCKGCKQDSDELSYFPKIDKNIGSWDVSEVVELDGKFNRRKEK